MLEGLAGAKQGRRLGCQAESGLYSVVMGSHRRFKAWGDLARAVHWED